VEAGNKKAQAMHPNFRRGGRGKPIQETQNITERREIQTQNEPVCRDGGPCKKKGKKKTTAEQRLAYVKRQLQRRQGGRNQKNAKKWGGAQCFFGTFGAHTSDRGKSTMLGGDDKKAEEYKLKRGGEG